MWNVFALYGHQRVLLFLKSSSPQLFFFSTFSLNPLPLSKSLTLSNHLYFCLSLSLSLSFSLPISPFIFLYNKKYCYCMVFRFFSHNSIQVRLAIKADALCASQVS